MQSPVLFSCFFAAWAVLAVTGALLFHRGDNAAFKRKWFPIYVILSGVVFTGLIVALVSADPGGAVPLMIVVPVIILISWLNIRMIRFCGKCGRLIYRYGSFWTPAKFCPSCGTPLNQAPGQ